MPADELSAAGITWRLAARVLLLNQRNELLLVRGHDLDNPARSWWFTPGGGIDPGEDPRQAAARELFEESGIQFPAGDLQGPVITRNAIFDFAEKTLHQSEQFFLGRYQGSGELSRQNWTAQEHEVLDELGWFSAAALREVNLEVFPVELPDLIEDFAQGWDGVSRHVGIVRE